MRILYFDCFSGISGDMMIGALIDAGADPIVLEQELKKLGIDSEYQLSFKKIIKNGVTATKFDVIVNQELHDHSHQHEGEGHSHHHSHEHESHVHHFHYDDEDHNHHQNSHLGKESEQFHHDDHDHRTYTSIVKMIKEANYVTSVEQMAISIFTKIGESEAKIHGTSLDEIHFHEVGAVDSIIDIVGTAILIQHLKIERICASEIPVGSGKIHIDHGLFPVPAPATLDILVGIPLAESKIKAELTTPTGAGIVAALSEQFGPMPSMTVSSIGYGAGTKNFPSQPNVLRVIIGEK